MTQVPIPSIGAVRERPDISKFGEAHVRQLVVQNAALERTLQELRLGLDSHSIVAMTDRRGYILEANDRFVELSKYSYDELIGAPQSIVNSGVHPKSFFKEMWATIGRGGIWQGEICNRAKDGSKYWVATTIVPLLGSDGKPDRYLSIRTDVTKLRETELRVRKLAYFDTLTGMPNRARMVKHLAEMPYEDFGEYQAYLAISFEDLALVNDAFGFEMGDRSLRGIAQMLTDLLEAPHSDASVGLVPTLVARVGSNTFGLHFNRLGSDEAEAMRQVEAMAPTLISRINAAVRACLGSLVDADLRIGYTLYRSQDGIDGAQIFTRTEIARRRAFATRLLGEPNIFSPQMVEVTQARVNLLFDLRHSLEDGHLRLYMQPIVRSDRTIVGYEALLRWEDPNRGLVQPDDFIPLAESTGLIVEIGAWVIEEACRTLVEWSTDESRKNLVIAVNVSEQQLRQDDFVETVLGALRRTGARPELLKLEVTETMIHSDVDRTVAALQELRDKNVKIALDDFGVGYSSLGYLKWLPVQTLKIDRTFIMNIVEDEIDAAMVRAIVGLGHRMGVQIVAEGVETEEQFALLSDFGADLFQGYLFGRPAPLTAEARDD